MLARNAGMRQIRRFQELGEFSQKTLCLTKGGVEKKDARKSASMGLWRALYALHFEPVLENGALFGAVFTSGSGVYDGGEDMGLEV